MKRKETSIKKNMFMNALLQGSSILFPLIVFPYVSRVLMPEGIGKVNFALSLVSYFAMVAQLGIPTYGVVACARVRDDREKLSKIVQELLIINCVTCLIVYAMMEICIAMVPAMQRDAPMYLMLSVTILLNALGVEWLYQAIEKYSYITKRSLIFKTVALIMTFLLIKKPDDCMMYGFVSVFAVSASNILNFINLRKHVTFKKTGEYHFRNHMSAMLTFCLISVSISIYTNLDSVMLGFMKGDAEVGYYTVAVKVKLALVSFLIAINGVLLPRFSYYLESGARDRMNSILRKTTKVMLGISMPLAILFMIFAREVVMILAGSDFEPAVPAMIAIMPTLVVIGISSLYGNQVLVPMGQEKTVAISAAVGAVTNLIINAILILPYGAAGASVSTLIAEVMVLIFILSKVDRDVLKAGFRNLGLSKIVLFNLMLLAAGLVFKKFGV